MTTDYSLDIPATWWHDAHDALPHHGLKLAQWCQDQGYDGAVITLHDRFLGSGANSAQRLTTTTGFTGSAGMAVITSHGHTLLCTDGRYATQAAKQAPHAHVVITSDSWPHVHAFCAAFHHHLSTQDAACKDLTNNRGPLKIVLDPWTHSIHQARKIQDQAPAHHWQPLWQADWLDSLILPPTTPMAPAQIEEIPHDISFQEKCHQIGLPRQGGVLWTAAPAWNWLLNLRSADQSCTPLLEGYALTRFDATTNRYCATVWTHWPRFISWQAENTCARDIDFACLSHMSQALNAYHLTNEPLQWDPRHTPWALHLNMQDHTASQWTTGHETANANPNKIDNMPASYPQIDSTVLQHECAVTTHNALVHHRSIKTLHEQHHIIQAHLHESIAVCRLLHWLDDTISPQIGTCPQNEEKYAPQTPYTTDLGDDHKPSIWTEWSVCLQLEALRREIPTYRSPSFPTIAGMNTNGAIIHYQPQASNAHPLASGMLLLDAGGQYAFGTTDMTRTVWIGKENPSFKHRHFYTLVLQAHAHLASLRFPWGTKGCHLDAAARSMLWAYGVDYAHSTGHGVGAFSCVHESPPSLSLSAHHHTLAAGMVVSNEPGYYEPGWAGIRLENLYLIQQNTPSPACQGRTLGCLHPLTWVPFDRRLIMTENLGTQQRRWIDTYHAQVWRLISPQLSAAGKTWLRQATAPLAYIGHEESDMLRQ